MYLNTMHWCEESALEMNCEIQRFVRLGSVFREQCIHIPQWAVSRFGLNLVLVQVFGVGVKVGVSDKQMKHQLQPGHIH